MDLKRILHFYLLLAVIGTTLVSWFQLNSILIMLLTGYCLWCDGDPLSKVKAAFSDGRFLAFFILFLLEVGGLLHTHNLFTGWKHVESKATLVAIPFIICTGPFSDGPDFRRLMWAYCRLLAGVCIWCLGSACVQYLRTGDAGEFFYHGIVVPVVVRSTERQRPDRAAGFFYRNAGFAGFEIIAVVAGGHLCGLLVALPEDNAGVEIVGAGTVLVAGNGATGFYG
jgi:hypothetical protein